MRLDRANPGSAQRQRGAVAVAFILMTALLLGFVALGLDAGRLYVSKTELQNAADSCALAAAAALTGANAGQLTIAENFGIAAGTRNLVGTQNVAVEIEADKSVTFSETLDGTYQTKSDVPPGDVLDMHYARCTVTETAIPTLMLQVANLLPGHDIGPSDAAASAVASLEPSVSNCALPLAICKKDLDLGVVPGDWIQGKLEAGGGIQGAFKWIEYPGYERTKDLAALIAGSGQCDLNSSNTIQSHPGEIDSLLKAWNTRLGIYRPGGPTASEARPDASGWVYNPTVCAANPSMCAPYNPTPGTPENAFADLRDVRRPNHQYGNVSVPNPNKWGTAEDFQSGGDRRLVVGPIVDCDALGSNGTTTIIDWGCYLILHPNYSPGEFMYLEYRGIASDTSSGCVTSGLPGGPAAGGPKVPALVQ